MAIEPTTDKIPRGATSFYDFPGEYGGQPTDSPAQQSTPARQPAGAGQNAQQPTEIPAGQSASQPARPTFATNDDIRKYILEQIEEEKKYSESSEDRAKRERREKREKFFAGLANGLGVFHEAYSYARGVRPMEMPALPEKWQERYDKMQAERDKHRDGMLNYYGMLGQLDKEERGWNYKVERDNKSDERFDRQQKRMEEQTRIQAQKAEAYRQYQESLANKNDEQAAYWKAKAQALEEGLPLDEALKRAKIAKEKAATNKYNADAAKSNRSGGGRGGGGRGGRKDDGMDEVTITENTYDPDNAFSNRVVSRKVTKTRVPRKQTSARPRQGGSPTGKKKIIW